MAELVRAWRDGERWWCVAQFAEDWSLQRVAGPIADEEGAHRIARLLCTRSVEYLKERNEEIRRCERIVICTRCGQRAKDGWTDERGQCGACHHRNIIVVGDCNTDNES